RAAQVQGPVQIGERSSLLLDPGRRKRNLLKQRPQRRILELVAEQDEVVFAGGHGADLEFDLTSGLLHRDPMISTALLQTANRTLGHRAFRIPALQFRPGSTPRRSIDASRAARARTGRRAPESRR